MLALFLTLTVALALLSWAELAPRRAERDGQPSGGTKSGGGQADPAAAPEAGAPPQGAPATAEQPTARELPPAATETEDDALLARLAALLDAAEPEAAPQPTAVPSTATAPQPVSAPQPAAARTAPRKPRPAPLPAALQPAALPVLRDFHPGDVLELELDGPAPRATDIAFRQIGRDTCVLIWGEPMLTLAGVEARRLSPSALRFRSPRAA